MKSHYKPIRFPDEMYQQIESSRDNIDFSKWVREAVKMRLEKDKGLTDDYAKELSELNKQVLALGRNLNQITKAVNGGKSVKVDLDTLKSLGEALKATQKNISEVRGKLL